MDGPPSCFDGAVLHRNTFRKRIDAWDTCPSIGFKGIS